MSVDVMVGFLLKLDASQKACTELFSADLSSNAVSCHALSCEGACLWRSAGWRFVFRCTLMSFDVLSWLDLSCPRLFGIVFVLLQTAPSKALLFQVFCYVLRRSSLL